ncbi:MAG: fumarylacetoacetate hydrolase family protein [Nocardioidaceae bacterium]|nr:fumarylacetoacetate hydrolase family protein [Nocardioidaceae bacterium]
MRLARLGPVGGEMPVVVVGDDMLSLASVTEDLDGAFWSSDGPDRVAAALGRGDLPVVDGADRLRIGPPIARPGMIVCIGHNYAAHAAESGVEPPEHPVVFLKAPNTVTGPHDPLVLPRGSRRTDWEVELGVVIGRPVSYLNSAADALACVAGLVLADDLSEREFQLELSGGQWSKGKCCPGFTPLGPWLVTPDEVDPQDLRLRSWVNGEPRQDSSTADQIVGVAELLWHLGRFMTLEPGDLVLTGTPEGVALSGRFPYLAPGDVIEVVIDGLGRQRQVCLAWEAEP